jgi:hypothetical protein
MATTVSALCTEIIAQGAFDLTSADVLTVLNRRHKKMVGKARTYRKTVSAGPTVANQAEYTAPADLVAALELLVAGVTYGKARRADKSRGALDRLWLTGDGGIFYENASSAGVDQFGLYPVPAEAGLAIDVYGAFLPPDLLLNDSVPLYVDDDAVEGLKEGVYATLLRAPGEARQDLAGGHEAVFVAETEELRLREKRRLRGNGPAQIRVQGINA